jgi:hypothetical protein
VMSVLTHRRSRTNSAALELSLHESGCGWRTVSAMKCNVSVDTCSSCRIHS